MSHPDKAMTRTAPRLLIVLLTTLTLVLVTTPAHAQKRTWQDARGDTSQDGLLDISTVSVTNTKKHTTVAVRVPREDPEVAIPLGEFRVYIDTNPKKAGPEFVWFITYPGHGGFYPVKKNKIQWNKSWVDLTKVTKCGKGLRETFDLSRGTLRIKVAHKKGCLGNPKKVRTQVRTTVTGYIADNYNETITYSSPERDFFPDRGRYSRWVKR